MKGQSEESWRNQCEKEPLQFSSAIQSFGALLFVQRETFSIDYASTNCASFFREADNLALGKTFNGLGNVTQAFLTSLTQTSKTISHLTGDIVPEPITLSIVALDDGWIIECEKDRFSNPIVTARMNAIHLELKTAKTIDSLNQLFVNNMRAITGFDRVMIYKFDEEWNGEVIAESVDPALGSYLHLHFPASDIPAIARKLYETNPSRYIADAKSQAIAIEGIDPAKPLDLTCSSLRSVSPMHIQYMLNMKVQSSLSIAIRLFDRLWGLIVCHHATATELPYSIRSCCQDLSVTFRVSLSEQITRNAMCGLDNIPRIIQGFFDRLMNEQDTYYFTQQLFEYFAERLQLSGVAIINNEGSVLSGVTIPNKTLMMIDHFFCAQSEGLWHTHSSRDAIPDDALIAISAAGILAIKVRSHGELHRIFFFRAEKPYNIHWAGNPNKPMERVIDGHWQISPRTSFELWVEEMRGQSAPWSKSDVALVSHLHAKLIRHLQ